MGEAIVYHREQARLTTAELAERSKLSARALIAIEKGETEPHWGTLREIASGLVVPLSQVFKTAERLERGQDQS